MFFILLLGTLVFIIGVRDGLESSPQESRLA